MQNRPACVSLLSVPSAQQADGKVTGFRGLAYSGGIVPNHGWAGDMAIDLASMALPETEVPILLNHDSDQIVGRARVANHGDRLEIVDGAFSAVTEHGRMVADLMAEGHPWSLSVGVNGRMLSADRAKTTKLNGREMRLDSVIRDARLLEVSFVPSGADPNAYAARLSARLGIQPPEDVSMTELEQARARIVELEAQVATLTSERDNARTEFAAAQTAMQTAARERRNGQIVALFGENAELTDAQRNVYVAMTDEQFSAVESALQAERRGDPELFRQQAGSGRNHEQPVRGTYSPPHGWSVDAERTQMHAKAIKYAADHKTDYLTAALAVEQGA